MAGDPLEALRRGARLGSQWLDASAEVSRREAVQRARRWRSRAFFIAQCSLAAGVAYALARYLFAVPVPLFAPVAAMVCLGMTYGQRLRRAVEITVGVAVGAFFGEAFFHLFGMGTWQVVAIVAAAMSAATLLGAGTLIVTQAGIQGLIIALLSGQTSTAFGRWFEALIGAATALVLATVSPSSALLRPRAGAADVLTRLSGLLIATASALRDRDEPAVQRALDGARETDAALTALRGHAADAREITRLTPWYRHRRADVLTISAQLPLVDRAVRNARVLIRRALASVQVGETVPEAYLTAMLDLAAVVDTVADGVRAAALDPRLPAAVVHVASETLDPAPGAELSAEVIRAQVRSMLVDLLEVLGVDTPTAQQAVRSATLPPAA